jgi:hypothetical protein
MGGSVGHEAPPEALPDYGEVSTHPTDIDSTAQGPSQQKVNACFHF